MSISQMIKLRLEVVKSCDQYPTADEWQMGVNPGLPVSGGLALKHCATVAVGVPAVVIVVIVVNN